MTEAQKVRFQRLRTWVTARKHEILRRLMGEEFPAWKERANEKVRVHVNGGHYVVKATRARIWHDCVQDDVSRAKIFTRYKAERLAQRYRDMVIVPVSA